MSNIWNPYAFGVTGQPVGPQTNALRVYGAEPSKEQLAMAQQTFAKFCANSRLSLVPNPMEQGFLPDGSEYRIVVVGNTRIMEVRVEGEDASSACGVYIDRDILVSGTPTAAPIFLTVGGRFGNPDGKWKAQAVTRKHAPDGVFIPSDNGRPVHASRSWHDQSLDEYYVQTDFSGNAERAGKDVLTFSGLSAWPHLAVLSVDGEKSFCRVYQDASSVAMAYAPAFNTNGLATPQPIVWTDFMPVYSVPAPTASAEHTIRSVATSPSGDKALVTRSTIDPSKYPPVPVGTEGEWPEYLTIELQYSVGTGLYARRQHWFSSEDEVEVIPLTFSGTAWSAGAPVHSGGAATCDPQSMWKMGSFGTRTRNGGGFRGRIVVHPTATASAIPGSVCSVEGALQDDVVELAIHGDHAYVEENDLDAPWKLVSDDQLNITGAWLTHDGEPQIVEVSREASWRMTSTGTTDYKQFRNYRCSPVSGGGLTWQDLAYSRLERTETSDFHRKRTRKTQARIGVDTLVLMEEVSEETGTMAVVELKEYPTIGDMTWVVTTTVSASLSVDYTQRRLLMADPQFRMLCYVEAAFNFSRGGSAQRVVTAEPGTGELVVSETGGDSDAAPAAPTADLVITVAGVEVFRRSVPTSRPDYGEVAEAEIVVDCTVPWGMADRKGYFGSAWCGTELRDLVVYGLWPGGINEHMDEPLGLAPTLGISMHPLAAAGAEYLAAEYAKDPKTGAGVLYIRNKPVSGPTPQLREIFTVDASGVNPVSRLVPDIEASETIHGVSPT